jgi:translation initiation factor 1
LNGVAKHLRGEHRLPGFSPQFSQHGVLFRAVAHRVCEQLIVQLMGVYHESLICRKGQPLQLDSHMSRYENLVDTLEKYNRHSGRFKYLRAVMARQKKSKRFRSGEGGMVFSTAADWTPETDEQESTGSLDPKATTLYVSLDRKQRAGKPVTMVEGLEYDGMALMTTGKELKALCGAGGAVKEGAILVQGDHRDKVIDFLENKGFRIKRKGG